MTSTIASASALAALTLFMIVSLVTVSVPTQATQELAAATQTAQANG